METNFLTEEKAVEIMRRHPILTFSLAKLPSRSEGA